MDPPTRRLLASALVAAALAQSSCGSVSGHAGADTSRRADEPAAARCGDARCDPGEGVAGCPADCLGIDWVAIEGGSFDMGSDDGPENERPAHAVAVSSFRLMKREATRREYRACVEAKACTAPRVEPGTDLLPPAYCTWGWEDRDDHPVNCISWDQARGFCQWLGARLPTEAEWEYAARSRGQELRYPWGDQLATCDRAVMGVEPYFVGCREERTHPVCSKALGHTAEGLCDMAGSVIEWVEDAGHDGYAGAPSDGSAWLDAAGAGGETPSRRVGRGGSLSTSDPAYLRTTARFLFDPAQPRYVVGVRCAR